MIHLLIKNPKTCKFGNHQYNTEYWALKGTIKEDRHYRDRHEGFGFKQPVGTQYGYEGKKDRVYNHIDPPKYCAENRGGGGGGGETVLGHVYGSAYPVTSDSDSDVECTTGVNDQGNAWRGHDGGGYVYDNADGGTYENDGAGGEAYTFPDGHGWTRDDDGVKEWFSAPGNDGSADTDDGCDDHGGSDNHHGSENEDEHGNTGGGDSGSEGGYEDGEYDEGAYDDGGYSDGGYDDGGYSDGGYDSD